MGVLHGFAANSLESLSMSKAYLLWYKAIPSLDLTTSNPKKNELAYIFNDELLIQIGFNCTDFNKVASCQEQIICINQDKNRPRCRDFSEQGIICLGR